MPGEGGARPEPSPVPQTADQAAINTASRLVDDARTVAVRNHQRTVHLEIRSGAAIDVGGVHPRGIQFDAHFAGCGMRFGLFAVLQYIVCRALARIPNRFHCVFLIRFQIGFTHKLTPALSLCDDEGLRGVGIISNHFKSLLA